MGVGLEVPQKVKPLRPPILDGRLIRDALLLLPDAERRFIISNTLPGCCVIYEMYRKPSGYVGYSYNDVPQ